VLTCKKLALLSPPITPMNARAVKSFPFGPDWMYEPKWDGNRLARSRAERKEFNIATLLSKRDRQVRK